MLKQSNPDTNNSSAQCWIVMAAYNEESVIATTIASLIPYQYSIVVVNDSSSDSTANIVKKQGYAHLCCHIVNLGQGAALQTGINYALDHNAKYIVTFDADGQHLAESVADLIEPLVHQQTDVVLASRFLKDSKIIGMPLSKLFVLKIALMLTRFTTGLKLTDTHNGLRAFSADAAKKLRITQNRMAHASQIISQIAANKMKFIEKPVEIHYTPYSIAKGQRLRNIINIAWETLTQKLHY